MYRALRPDKTILAALEATIDDWLRKQPTPLDRMAQLSLDELKMQAKKWCGELRGFCSANVVKTEATIGGGSLPGQSFESIGVALRHSQLNTLQHALLKLETPVIGRMQNDQLIFDARTILGLDKGKQFIDSLKTALTSVAG